MLMCIESNESLINYLIHFEVTMPSGKNKISDLTVKQIRSDYLITKSMTKTAKMFGLSETTVRLIVGEKGAYAKKP